MYSFQNFEVRDFAKNAYLSNNRSAMGKIINSFIGAINEHNTLPKLVVVVLDDDITRHIQTDHADSYDLIHRITGWLVKEFEKAI